MRSFDVFNAVFFGLMLFSSDFYQIHFTTIDNEDESMEQFRGKKIMIVILPVTEMPGDSSFLKSVVRASQNYKDKISVIGVPSFEDGYRDVDSNKLAYRYRVTLGRTIIIAKGMHTKKSSRSNQSLLFYWLTHADQNGHFDSDITGSRKKFFINEKGELYGIISSDGELSNELMDRMVNN